VSQGVAVHYRSPLGRKGKPERPPPTESVTALRQHHLWRSAQSGQRADLAIPGGQLLQAEGRIGGTGVRSDDGGDRAVDEVGLAAKLGRAGAFAKGVAAVVLVDPLAVEPRDSRAILVQTLGEPRRIAAVIGGATRNRAR